MFTWKPIYLELAEKLLAYRSRQHQLLTWLQEMKQAGLPAISVTDFKPEGTPITLAEIDPFTFFSNFNRGIKNEHRVEILRMLKGKMGLVAGLPDEFDGVPVASSQKAWFFPWAYERDPNAIPLLWDFAEDVRAQEPSRLRADLFEQCLQIKQVGLAKLTMGMFWLQPDRYVALDQVNRTYLIDRHAFTTARLKPKTLPDYVTLLDSIRDATHVDPPRLSVDAYTHGLTVTLDPMAVDRGLRAYLKRLAEEAACSVSELVERIKAPAGSGESEITNRTIHQKELQEALSRSDLKKKELKLVVDKLWALKGRTDVIRRNAYFRSDQVMDDVRALLDDDSGVPAAMRISDFVEAASAHGYRPEVGEDLTLPGQFASVLLSSRRPEEFVDFKKRRWNDLYKQVMQTNGVLLNGKHYGHLLLRAGSFASLLAQTPTFKEFFGESKELWTVAGVAWALKDGPPKGQTMTKPTPRVPTDDEPPPGPAPALPAKNIILYGPPGTGKTYTLCTTYLPRFTERGTTKSGDVTRRYEFTTFHQSYSYEEFVEGIKPTLDTDEGADLRYEIKPGILRQIAKRAEADPDHDYALFIDEINRGNIASIFGELITLLEEDKRLGAAFEIKVRLPYSRDSFGLPPNLYVIGTMNTADRSVEALDAALRRRFFFIPCLPKVELLPDERVGDLEVDLRRMLTVMNARLERLLDRDHCLGHSYFLGVSKAENPLDALRQAFANKVLPLLEEYFYGDIGKIGLVLGAAFIRKRTTPERFAACGWEADEDEDRASFERTDPMTLDVGAFQAIYA